MEKSPWMLCYIANNHLLCVHFKCTSYNEIYYSDIFRTSPEQYQSGQIDCQNRNKTSNNIFKNMSFPNGISD